MEYQTIKYEVSDSVLTVTLNRPDQLNAFGAVMNKELLDAFSKADEDDNVRVVLVTGAGRAFCAGADLAQGGQSLDHLKQGSEETPVTHRDGAEVIPLRLYDLKKPVIAAINGPAVGVGLTMTLPMDIRLASETARMGFVFVRRGLIMEMCSSWFLPRIVGISRSLEWLVTGKVFDAREALASGLVSEVLAPDALIPRARELANEIARNTSAISVALCRQLLWKMLGADHPGEANKLDSEYFPWAASQPDAREGIASFLEKRPPKFSMKASSQMPPSYPWWK